MKHVVEDVISGLEAGRLTRREAIGALTALLTTALGAPRARAGQGAAPAPTFQSSGLNHVALRVTDMERSVGFYRRHLGLGVLREGSSNSFLSCGGNNFLALFRSQAAGLDHYCFTVPEYDASRTVKTLDAAGLKNERHQDRVYFDDPDGITVQLTGQWDDYPGGRPNS